MFARLKARSASERLSLKQLLRSYVEQGLNATPASSGSQRSGHTLPGLEGPWAISGQQLSNAALFDLLDAWRGAATGRGAPPAPQGGPHRCGGYSSGDAAG
jgi:hypothetical protein